MDNSPGTPTVHQGHIYYSCIVVTWVLPEKKTRITTYLSSYASKIHGLTNRQSEL